MRRKGNRPKRSNTFRTALLAAIVVLALLAVVMLRGVLTPIIVALALAYIIDPVLIWLEAHGVRRLLSTTVLYIAGLGLLSLTCATIGPKVWQQGRNFYINVSSAARDYGSEVLPQKDESEHMEDEEPVGSSESPSKSQVPKAGGPRSALETIIERHFSDLGQPAAQYIREHSDQIASKVSSIALNLAEKAARGISSAADFLVGTVIMLIFTFFFMLHFQDMVQSVRKYLPIAHRNRILKIARKIDAAVSNFFRGRLLVCLVSAVVYVAGLRISGIEYWLLIGLAGGILGFIPILGVILPLIPASAFALLTDSPWFSLIGVLITFSLVQWVVEPIAGTFILSKQVKMHPVTIILSLLMGGSMFGLFGLLLSVPVTAVIRILGDEFLLPTLRSMAGREVEESSG